MPKYLLAAEADKIQEYVFRSAKLREAVGGSELVNDFCIRAAEAAEQENAQVIIADGGSFRLIFDCPQKAAEFGNKLAESYRRLTGGSLSVAAAQSIDEGGFAAAGDKACLALRRAKETGRLAVTPVHLPQMAFCASCGVGVAKKKAVRIAGELPDYCCHICFMKQKARDKGHQVFQEGFRKAVVSYAQDSCDVRIDWQKLNFADKAEDIAALNKSSTVAYLVADGNSIGKLFSRCQTPEEMTSLSRRLSDAMRQSLAEVCVKLGKALQIQQGATMPIMPLIIGGDDCVALLNAEYAMAAARDYCLAFEHALANYATDDFKPTMSAAVVFCKLNYPFTLAYQQAENMLADAKRLGKGFTLWYKNLGGKTGGFSTISYDVITGSLLPVIDKPDARFCDTAKPFFVLGEGASPATESFGYSIDELFEMRKILNIGIPKGRLQAVRSLFAGEQLPESSNDIQRWRRQAAEIIDRTLKSAKDKQAGYALKKVIGDWEDPANAANDVRPWRELDRKYEKCSVHLLPDIIRLWDYLKDWDACEKRSIEVNEA